MDLMLLRMFQRQIAFQCQGILIATTQINGLLQQPSANQAELWIAVQSLLTSAANISKACWGQGGKYEKERQPLRRSLKITKKSPLRKVWTRNRFDHYDEALDDWWQKSKNRNHLDMMIGPPSMVKGFANVERFRVLDPTTMNLIFWGRAFNLQKVVSEAERVLAIAAMEAAKPHWDPSKMSGGGQ